MLRKGLLPVLLAFYIMLTTCQPSPPTNQSPSASQQESEPALTFLEFLQGSDHLEDSLRANWQAVAIHYLPDSTVHENSELHTQQIPYPSPYKLLFYEYLAEPTINNQMYMSIFDTSGQVMDLLKLQRVSFDGNVTINVIDEKILEIEYYDFYRAGGRHIDEAYTSNKDKTKPSPLPTSEEIPGLKQYYIYENYLITAEGKFKSLSVADSVNLHRYFPFTSMRILSKDELGRYRPAQIRYMIDEIYASHGYIFDDPKMLRRFKRSKWYKPTHSRVDSMLSDVENLNITTLSKHLQAIEK